MTIKKKTQRRLEIDLTGPRGNAYYLLGEAINLAIAFGYDSDKIQAEMTSGDYENLVQVFDKYFGDQVTLYR